MAGGARFRATLTVALALTALAALAPATASAGGCRDKHGPRFDVRLSGSEDAWEENSKGRWSETLEWSAKWKKVRLEITRCDGELHRVTMQGNDGEIRASVEYHEPDIFIPPDDCLPGAFCPRRASVSGEGTTIPGCNFSHSGTYRADLSVNAYFRGRHKNVVISSGPRDDRLRRDETAAQEAACDDAGRVGFLGVPEFQNDGLGWQISNYFVGATNDSTVPDLIRDLARGSGGAAGASRTRSRERSDDEAMTAVEASIRFGQGSRIRNRFPNGF